MLNCLEWNKASFNKACPIQLKTWKTIFISTTLTKAWFPTTKSFFFLLNKVWHREQHHRKEKRYYVKSKQHYCCRLWSQGSHCCTYLSMSVTRKSLPTYQHVYLFNSTQKLFSKFEQKFPTSGNLHTCVMWKAIYLF